MPHIRIALFALSLAACGGDSPANAAGADPHGQTAAQQAPVVDPATAAKTQLGEWLFFDPRLSSTGKMSCSTCHLPEMAWTDGKKLSPKHDGSPNTRNTPTMFNVGSLERLYWDGRAPSLEKNIVAAWKGQAGGDPAAVSAVLAGIPQYTAQFEAAKLGPPSEATIVEALATFLRTLRSGDAPFDQWRGGKKDAISAEAISGYELFKGKAGCVVCHQEPLFTDRAFHNAGVGMDAEKPDPGAGGEKAMNDPRLIGYFKTPTLREIAATAPYFHDGSAATLEEAVRFMAAGGRENPTKSPELINRTLKDDEIAHLVAFLKTLTSPTTAKAPTLPPSPAPK